MTPESYAASPRPAGRSPESAPTEAPTEAAAPPPVPPKALELARAARRITVLTGAGMSAESGVATFRDAQTGLWSHFDPAQLATEEAWFADKPFVNAWYLWRVHLVRQAAPNAGHLALAEWAALPGKEIRIVTQNIDDLHERAGSAVLAHLHGSLFAWRCDTCGASQLTPEPPTEPMERVAPADCVLCGEAVRPGVVWFGEYLPQEPFAAAVEAVQDADLVVVVGTSGIVQPAASLPHLAGARGIPVLEIDPRETELTEAADVVWRSTAAAALPALVAALRAESA
ncbi:MAG TPA: NAD-dependent deacylase [Dermatophilaceae bacterium]|nr:NAD-dependent deacylase [Dermatophilaceae bacterium]